PRSATVETIEYRVNDCFRRSMNGVALASDGPDMRDIVTYFWYLARDVPVAPVSTANRLAKWATFVPDTSRGAAVYVATCAKCHGPAGEGTVADPPMRGPHSYHIRPGLSRIRTAAALPSDNLPDHHPPHDSGQPAAR